MFLDNKEVRNARKDARQGTDDPDFRLMVQLDVTLPGKCKLTVEVWHAAGVFGRDELLGKTDIDLEDRALNPDWRSICFPEPKDGGKQESHTPVEMRALMLDGHPRGRLEMVVDIFQVGYSYSFPCLSALFCVLCAPGDCRTAAWPRRLRLRDRAELVGSLSISSAPILPLGSPAAVAGCQGSGRAPPAS